MYIDAFEVLEQFITLNWMPYTTRMVRTTQEERVVHRYLHKGGSCAINCFQSFWSVSKYI